MYMSVHTSCVYVHECAYIRCVCTGVCIHHVCMYMGVHTSGVYVHECAYTIARVPRLPRVLNTTRMEHYHKHSAEPLYLLCT